MRRYLNIEIGISWLFRVVVVCVTLLLGNRVVAQQDPMYTQYMNNMLSINPAYAGSNDMLSMMALSRNQWVNYGQGAPETRTFALHSPLRNYHMGLGLSFLYDKWWPVTQTGMYIDYSYTIDFNTVQHLALGLKAGINFYEAGLSDLKTIDALDPTFANDITRSFLPNVGVGAFYYTDRFYAGLSAPKLIENIINVEEGGYATQNISKERIHFFFMAGYVFDVNRIVKFKPYFLTKFVKNAPVSFDFSGMFLLYDKLWLGAMFRLGDSFGGLFQLQVTNQLKIGYSYDLTTSQLGAYNKGTHEIMVSYDFNFGRDRVRSPRYF